MIGETILHYKILEKLGEGGMGVVYLAEDLNLERKVAIKFLPRQISGNSEERERFKIEAKTAAALNHTNIATIHSIEETGDDTFIVMEFIDGIELKDKIKSGPIQTKKAINIAIQIAEGLGAAHKKGIVHRDIKSQNIMITEDGKVKIMDFGLAKIGGSSQLTKMGTTLGTVAYMSPEQAMGKELDHRTDIWSFGVVLYEMLTGQLPFKGEYDQAVIYSILNEEPEQIINIKDGLPEGLENILKRSLLKDRNTRYQNINDMLNDLKHPDSQVSISLDSENKTPFTSKRRKLSAIMFTDMVGYSALTQKNESLALELLEIQKQVVRSIFPKYDGKEIETIGDAFFIEFNSTLEAVNCAIEIQKSMYERNAGVDDSEKIILRLGLHVGDVVHIGSQVHGDGVNIAARLEPLSPPGGICLSEDVVRQVQNKIELPLRKVGVKKLKNIDTPINIYYIVLPWEEKTELYSESIKKKPRIKIKRSVLSFILVVVSVIAVLLVLKYFNGTLKQEFNNRIAVLPLVNISQNSDDNYFVDGMTEELISQLAKISGLNVIARTSVMKYKNARLNTADIGNELGVGTILEGSVRTAVNKARVSVQLIDVKTQESIWAQDYDREVKDIFKIQSDIALRIAEQLKIQLLTTEKQQLEKRGTENADAYRSYLLGKYQLNQRTPESIYNGIKFFKEAIEYDPEFALAYVGLTDCYTLISGAGYENLQEEDAIKKAYIAIQKALELDPTSAEAYNSFAYLKFRLEWNWKEAEKYFKKAIELQPSYASAYERYALFLACIGKKDEAISTMKEAYKLDPLSASVSTGVGRMYHFAGQYDKAIAQFQKTLKANPDYVEAVFGMGLTYIQTSKIDAAISYLKKAIELSNGRLIVKAILGATYARAGKIEDALEIKSELLKLQEKEKISPFYFAVIDAGLGNYNTAIDSLYKAYDEHFGILVYSAADILFDDLRDYQRYNELLRKMKLVED
jgi:adenylate cyclase